MDDSRISNITKLKRFLEFSQKVVIRLNTIDEKYTLIQGTVIKYRYQKLTKKDKGIVLSYLKKITGLKKTQLHKLIHRALTGVLTRKTYVRHNPRLVYKACDIKLLEKTDALHLRLNSLATKEILRREYELFGNKDFENISKVSASHINAVDEVCRWELVASVPRILEIFMEDILYDILMQFPFVVFNFHSDRGSEYINHVVCNLLNKLLINQTKSRSRHCNDNALVESKNGTVVRKNFGYFYVNQSLCDELNKFQFTFSVSLDC